MSGSKTTSQLVNNQVVKLILSKLNSRAIYVDEQYHVSSKIHADPKFKLNYLSWEERRVGKPLFIQAAFAWDKRTVTAVEHLVPQPVTSITDDEDKMFEFVKQNSGNENDRFTDQEIDLILCTRTTYCVWYEFAICLHGRYTASHREPRSGAAVESIDDRLFNCVGYIDTILL